MNNQPLSIPLAIIGAGIIIAGAIFFTGASGSGSPASVNNAQGEQPSIDVAPITEEDHIRGNPNAELMIVEYSDLECPFCQRFHGTLGQVMDEYGTDGNVAWVYRQFPIVQLHSKAPKESEASECAAELGGDTAFWDYVDRVFEVTPSNDGLNLDRLPDIAEEVGLDRAAFTECLDSGKYSTHIEEDVQAAAAAGANGTPYSVIMLAEEVSDEAKEAIREIRVQNGIPSDRLFIAESNTEVGISGAFPYELMSRIIDILLAGEEEDES